MPTLGMLKRPRPLSMRRTSTVCGDRLERAADARERLPAAQVRRVVVARPQVVHVLRRAEQLEVLDRARVPAGDVARELLEHRRRALAPAERDRVRDLGAREPARAAERVQRLVADQVADVGDRPVGAGLDELVVVELLEVLLDHARSRRRTPASSELQRAAAVRRSARRRATRVDSAGSSRSTAVASRVELGIATLAFMAAGPGRIVRRRRASAARRRAAGAGERCDRQRGEEARHEHRARARRCGAARSTWTATTPATPCATALTSSTETPWPKSRASKANAARSARLDRRQHERGVRVVGDLDRRAQAEARVAIALQARAASADRHSSGARPAGCRTCRSSPAPPRRARRRRSGTRRAPARSRIHSACALAMPAKARAKSS